VQRQLEGRVLDRTGRPVVAVWGLAYKKNTHSTKNSMALRVIENLRGRADVRAYDPLVKQPGADVPATLVESRDAALVGADCLLILTDWDEFATPPDAGFRAMRRPVVIDCVGVMDPRRTALPGVEYITMGRAVRA
jgi:UDPglucose 6-dehydrogenase